MGAGAEVALGRVAALTSTTRRCDGELTSETVAARGERKKKKNEGIKEGVYVSDEQRERVQIRGGSHLRRGVAGQGLSGSGFSAVLRKERKLAFQRRNDDDDDDNEGFCARNLGHHYNPGLPRFHGSHNFR